jgi:eukaryotic-like serine/threonine-protein kinase
VSLLHPMRRFAAKWLVRHRQVIAQTTTTLNLGGTWNDRDIILFARSGAGILRVSASGGEPQPVTTPSSASDETSHAWPLFLPDGQHFIYLKVRQTGSELIWRALDSPEEHVVRKMTSKAWFSPTGHLLFRLDGPIVAQAFDPSTGTLSGQALQIEREAWAASQGRSALALSTAGVMAHRTGQAGGALAQLAWLDRKGTRERRSHL